MNRKERRAELQNLKFLHTEKQAKLSEETLDDGSVKFEVEGFASTEAKDGSGDMVMVDGIKLDRYMKNPVLKRGHKRGEENNIGIVKELSVREENGVKGLFIKADVILNPEIETHKELIHGLRHNLIKWFSIGFGQIEEVYDTEKEANVINSLELFEVSLVDIPDNPLTVRKMIDMILDEKGAKETEEVEAKEEETEEVKEEKDVETEEIEEQTEEKKEVEEVEENACGEDKKEEEKEEVKTEEETEEKAVVDNINKDDVFTTQEEAINRAAQIGLEGYHEHVIEDGRIVYKPGETHEEYLARVEELVQSTENEVVENPGQEKEEIQEEGKDVEVEEVKESEETTEEVKEDQAAEDIQAQDSWNAEVAETETVETEGWNADQVDSAEEKQSVEIETKDAEVSEVKTLEEKVKALQEDVAEHQKALESMVDANKELIEKNSQLEKRLDRAKQFKVQNGIAYQGGEENPYHKGKIGSFVKMMRG